MKITLEPTRIYTGKSTIRMYNADCMRLLESGKRWDLAICDVPYGIGESKKAGNRPKISVKYQVKDWDDSPPDVSYFNKLMSVSSNQILWGANHFISLIPYDSPSWIFWNKVRESQDFADGELAWTSFSSAVKMFTFAWDGFRQGDMKNKEHRIHPTQKPVKLYKWLLKNYAKPGDTILDTHGGSMSLAIACWDIGFDLDICELDSDYFDSAVKRFEQHISQQTLF
jgi:site-specific DNA-methyltransferase (adenine-specific)